MKKYKLRLSIGLVVAALGIMIIQQAISKNFFFNAPAPVEDNSPLDCGAQNLLPECANDGRAHDFYYAINYDMRGPGIQNPRSASISVKIVNTQDAIKTTRCLSPGRNIDVNKVETVSPAKFTGTYEEFQTFIEEDRTFRVLPHSLCGLGGPIEGRGLPQTDTLPYSASFIETGWFDVRKAWVVAAVFEDGYNCNPENCDDGGNDDDSDGDGIPDNEDDCPNDPNNGCNDSDGDGIDDEDDDCPDDPTNTCDDECPQPTIRVKNQ